MKLRDGVVADAVISADGVYRYSLSRVWGDGSDLVLWIMLNPSTASADVDDWTVRRCQNLARAWGHGGIVVGNLFALRATDPRWLRKVREPVGLENNEHLRRLLGNPERVSRVVAAWGAGGSYLGRGEAVRALVRDEGRLLQVLGTTEAGYPRHPRSAPGVALPSIWGGPRR